MEMPLFNPLKIRKVEVKFYLFAFFMSLSQGVLQNLVESKRQIKNTQQDKPIEY